MDLVDEIRLRTLKRIIPGKSVAPYSHKDLYKTEAGWKARRQCHDGSKRLA